MNRDKELIRGGFARKGAGIKRILPKHILRNQSYRKLITNVFDTYLFVLFKPIFIISERLTFEIISPNSRKKSLKIPRKNLFRFQGSQGGVSPDSGEISL